MTIIAKNLSNTTGTSSNKFAIDKMVVEYINDGVNDGAKLSFPGYSPVYIRARDPFVASKWFNGAENPSTTIGNNGDYYLNTTAGGIFYKSSNLWALVASVTGPEGPIGQTGNIGPTGPQGVQGIQGPAASIAIADDVSLTNLEDGDVLSYNNNTQRWTNVGKRSIVDGGNF